MIKTCDGCGYTRNTRPDAGLCAKCEIQRRREFFDSQWREQLDGLGYTFIRYDVYKGSHSKVEVTNRVCGHTYITKLNNILSGKSKCSVCGPVKRMAHAMKHYIDKYGRTYDVTLWKDYCDRARTLSNEVYLKHKAEMNPNNYPRVKPNTNPDAVNLDHIIPIIYGFKNGLPLELICDRRNLRIVPARENLRKKQKLTDEAEKLLEELINQS